MIPCFLTSDLTMAITKPRRAQILTNDEIKELYDCPAFNANQRGGLGTFRPNVTLIATTL